MTIKHVVDIGLRGHGDSGRGCLDHTGGSRRDIAVARIALFAGDSACTLIGSAVTVASFENSFLRFSVFFLLL